MERVLEACEIALDGDQGAAPPTTSLAAIKTRKTFNTMIHFSNAQKWQSREGFREITQNWRDAIICGFRLHERDFHVVLLEVPRGPHIDIVYKAFDSSKEGPCLGYIWYNGETGVVEISNRNAALTLENLYTGNTTKGEQAEDDAMKAMQAGKHGEGLKVAAVVMLRSPEKHHVECASSGYTWRFDFCKTTGSLVIVVSRISPTALTKALKRSVPDVVPYVSDPTSDVTFTIGEQKPGVDEYKNAIDRAPVSRPEFGKWTQCALFLSCPRADDLVKTKHGDLLLGTQQQGNIYLKGLLVKETRGERYSSSMALPLKYGYNFVRGETNRERESLASLAEQSSLMNKIWSEALEERPDLVENLVEMLNGRIPYADVADAGRYLEPGAASRIQKFLTGEPSADRWYYTEIEKFKNPQVEDVITGFGRVPCLLEKPCWDVLRKHRLFRTAGEEEIWRFSASQPVSPPSDDFATPMTRLLRACLHACPQTDPVETRFVKADNLRLQVLLSGHRRLLRIHERWLRPDHAAAAFGSPDGRGRNMQDVIYRTVIALFSEAVWQIPLSCFSDGGGGGSTEWKRQAAITLACGRVLEYLRLSPLVASRCSKPQHGLSVVWGDREGGVSSAEMQIQCHHVSQCTHPRGVLLAKDACLNLEAGAACKTFEIPRGVTNYCFKLDPEETYFFVLLDPSAPDSIVRVSDIVRLPRQPAPVSSTPEPATGTHASVAASPNQMLMTGANGNVSDLNDGRRERTINPAGGEVRVHPPAPSLSGGSGLGLPLQGQDNISADYRWISDSDSGIFIGIPSTLERTGRSENRKRRRDNVDQYDED